MSSDRSVAWLPFVLTVSTVSTASACGESSPQPVSVPPASSAPAPTTTASTPTVATATASAPSAATASALPASAPVCEATCKGKVTSAIEAELTERAKKSHRCYDNALVKDRNLEGKVVIEVVVGRDGSICSSKVKSNDTGLDAVAGCAAGSFAASALPVPDNGCATVAVPLAFKPKK